MFSHHVGKKKFDLRVGCRPFYIASKVMYTSVFRIGTVTRHPAHPGDTIPLQNRAAAVQEMHWSTNHKTVYTVCARMSSVNQGLISVCLHHYKFICPNMSITDEPYLHSAEHWVVFSTVWETWAESLSATLIKLSRVPLPVGTDWVVCVQHQQKEKTCQGVSHFKQV